MTQVWICYIQNEVMAILKSSILILSLIMITMQGRAAEFENCPDTAYRKYRAVQECPKNIVHYHCLRNGSNHCSGNSSTPDTVIEICMLPTKYSRGKRAVYCENLDAEKCSKERFSPEFLWSNESDRCPYLKSNCSEEGQVIVSNELHDTDSWCRCDYTRGYDYISPPKDKCKCKPREEDCACYIKQCDREGYVLSQDYDCVDRNNRSEIIVCPEIDTQMSQEKESPNITEIVHENLDKDNLPIIIITILVTMTLVIVLSCRQVLKKEAPTSVVISPSPITVNEGQTITARCTALGSPTIEYTWFKDNSNTQLSTCSVLQITSSTRTDAGMYQCRASNTHGNADATVLVDVQYIPTITASIVPSVSDGNPVTITCTVTATPAATQIVWQRFVDSGVTITLDLSSNRYSGGTTSNPSLTINSVQEGDQGQYFCQASNSVGTGISNHVTVTGDFSTRTIFHQLNDMIVVTPFEEVQQLAEIKKIDNEENIRFIILRGQTGAGKTHAAYWFCNEVKRKYSVIASLSAVDKTKFIESLKSLAKNLHLDLEHKEDDMFKIIESISTTIVTHLNNVLKESRKCLYLILIDDVHVDDSGDDLSEMVLKTIYLLKEVNTFKFIITTTNSMLKDKFVQQATAKEVVFEGMTNKECESFLQVSPRFKEETNESIHNLIENIGRLPITINSARKFMDALKMHINKYLKIYEKLKNAENTIMSEVVKCQKIPLNYMKKSLCDTIWEVVTLFPYLDYGSVCPELIEACCHHFCNDDTHAHTIILKFREFSLCQQLHRPKQRISKINDNQEDILLSFHSETMLTLKLFDKSNESNNKERQKLFVLLKMFCFEIDFDTRVDTTLERNLMFLPHARNVLRLFEKYEYDLNETEKVYTSFINFIIGKTILYHGMDIPLAHKHLMKSRKLCLEIVKEDSDLTSKKCPYLASKKGTDTEEVPIMQKERVTHGYESLSTKTLDHDFVKTFVLNKRRNKRDTYVLQQESGGAKLCQSNYLSEQEYRHLTTFKLAMPLESLCKTFLSELMLHILHDNGRALDELMSGAETSEQVKRACAFEVDTYKELNNLKKSEEEFKNFPLLRYLAIERGEQDINVHQCTPEDIKSHIENLKKLLDKPYHYFEFGVVKTLSNNLEHHNLNCYRLLIKCIIEKYKISSESEQGEILIEGKKYVNILHEILSKIETDENAVKWVEIPKFYNQCAHFFQLSGSLNDQNDLRHAVELYGKAIEIEENRQAYITRFLQEGYHGKVNCLLILNMEADAKSIFDKLKNTLPKSSEFLIKMEELFLKMDN